MSSNKPEQQTSPVDGRTEQVPEALMALWERALPNMMDRLAVLERAVAQLEEGRFTKGTREETVREAHKLAGSLGTYGLMSGSRTAREIELRLESEKASPEALLAPWLQERVQKIARLLRDNGGTPEKMQEKTGGSISAPGGNNTKALTMKAPRETPVPKEVGGLSIRWEDPEGEATDGPSGSSSRPIVSMEGPGSSAGALEEHPALGRFLRRVVHELEDVEAAVAAFIRQAGRHEGETGTAGEQQEAARRLERVAGWLQEVGIDLPARRARELALRMNGPLDHVGVTRVAQEILTLQRLIGRWVRDEKREVRSRILVVSSDRAWGQKTQTALEVEGHRVEVVDSGHRPGFRTEGLAGIVVDGGDGTLEGLQGLGMSGPSVPVVYAVRTPDTRRRLEAGRLGADRVVDRRLPARELCGILSDLLMVSGGTSGRVLLVDDDETVLQAVEATLRHAGYEVTGVQGPQRFWQALEETSPELVITDLDMPDMDGAELTLAMRTDARWVNLPVIFLSSKDDAASLRRVFEAGADDFVPKPLRPELLLSRVRARLARLRSRSATGHLDPVTRLPVGAVFEHTLDDLVQSADQMRRDLTVAVLRLDAASHLRDRLGLVGLEREEMRLARAVSGHLDPPAVAGRRETDRFVLVLPETDLQEASALVAPIVEAFAVAADPQEGRPETTVSAGLAQCGVNGRSPVELVAAAETARVRAEEAGGSKVFLAGENAASRRLEQVDVLVVDDDPTIGELLLETLTQKGWHVAWEPDSERAVKRLTGPERDLRARVVLLDVNMPGMDGLTVLRLLRENQVVPPTHVVMLTVRAREDEVVRALNMGASDHVAKPFSVPVLITRVQRALGEV